MSPSFYFMRFFTSLFDGAQRQLRRRNPRALLALLAGCFLALYICFWATRERLTGPQRVFAYGSLMHGLQNHRLIERAQLVHRAATTSSDYFLTDSGGGYAYAIASGRVPACRGVHARTALLGEVYEVNVSVLHELDALEGHPTKYRRELVHVAPGGGAPRQSAWAYLLVDPPTLAKAVLMRPVSPAGDWRGHHRAARTPAEPTWPTSRRSAEVSEERVAAVLETMRKKNAALRELGLADATDERLEQKWAVFSYGSNGVQQLRERVRNPGLTARRCEVRGAVRAFAGFSTRWESAVATVLPCHGGRVLGSIVELRAEELLRLDGFEGVDRADTYGSGGRYRRQDVSVLVHAPAEKRGHQPPTPTAALMYVMTNHTWVGPPGARYLAACHANVDEFWPGEPIEVRDGSTGARERLLALA